MKTLQLAIIAISLLVLVIHEVNAQNGNVLEENMTISKHLAHMEYPLEQFKSGTPASDVKCNDGFTLILKSENGSPACVKPDTVQILIERGWGTLRGIQTFLPYGNTNSTSLGNNTLPASFMPCDTPFPQSNTGIQMLYMPTNSIGKICLRYYNPNNFSLPVSHLAISDLNDTNQNVTNITTWSDTSYNTISNGYFFQVNWIKSGNQSGFYRLDGLSCTGIPFAIGYDNNSRITSSDFPFVRMSVSCQAGEIRPEIDSTTGIGVKYIPYP